jgi:hypothetical protein
MGNRGAQVIYRLFEIVPLGKDQRTKIPFNWSNLQISKSVPGLKNFFSQGRVIDASKIFRSNDRDEVEIPVVLGMNDSARNFTINLKPYNENQCHIEIKEHFPRRASKTILDDAGIIHLSKLNRVADEETELVSHLRREIQYLTKTQEPQTRSLAANRDAAADLAKPNDSIQTGGLTIEGSNEKVASFLSSSNIEVEHGSKPGSKPRYKLEKLIRLIDPSARSAGSTLKFKLTNPDGKDQAKLTVSDGSGNVLLKDSTVRIERSTRHQDRSPGVQALFKAVARLNKDYNAAQAA